MPNKKEQFENGLKPKIQIAGMQGGNIIQRMRDLNIPAVSITVIENGKPWRDEYRLPAVTTDKPPLFQAASISKTINAVLAMKVFNTCL